jgi:hypothetical protein
LGLQNLKHIKMTIKEQFEIQWAKLSMLKDPIQKQTAELWYRMGAIDQMISTSNEIKSIQERINDELDGN